MIARALLLGACGLGLLGLAPGSAHPGSSAARPATLSAASTPAGALEADPRPPHPGASRATVSAQRASRSRTVHPAKKRVTRKLTGRWVRPSSAAIVSPFGMRWGRPHKGVDFGAHYGAPIYAIGDGVVVGVGYQSGESGYGQITIIRHRNGFYSAYAHQSSYVVHVGDHVSAGEVIGYVGSTGHSTGPHLHFEIRTFTHGGQINPVPWLRSHGVRV
jgi:murein DD-endopeptidase MepM/ murein hydrolase activator NlpD